MRTFVAAAALVLFAGVALAEDITGFISKESKKGYVSILTKGEDKAKEYKLAPDVKVSGKAGGKKGKAVSSLSDFTEALENSKKGLFGTITVEGGEVKAIRVGGKGKKGAGEE